MKENKAQQGILFCDGRTGKCQYQFLNKMKRGSIPQDLCPEECTLGLLNDLLVHRLRRVVHDHRALLVVDLGVDTGVADQVDNPLLTLILVQTETGRKVPSEIQLVLPDTLYFNNRRT